MTDDLKRRIDALRDEIDAADPGTRRALLDHLEEAALTLEAKGVAMPRWAKSRLAEADDDGADDAFDNMPV